MRYNSQHDLHPGIMDSLCQVLIFLECAIGRVELIIISWMVIRKLDNRPEPDGIETERLNAWQDLFAHSFKTADITSATVRRTAGRQIENDCIIEPFRTVFRNGDAGFSVKLMNPLFHLSAQ